MTSLHGIYAYNDICPYVCPYKRMTFPKKIVDFLKEKELELGKKIERVAIELFNFAFQRATKEKIDFQVVLLTEVIVPPLEKINKLDERTKTIFRKIVAQMYPVFANTTVAEEIKENFSINNQLLKEVFEAAASETAPLFIERIDQINPRLLNQRYCFQINMSDELELHKISEYITTQYKVSKGIFSNSQEMQELFSEIAEISQRIELSHGLPEEGDLLIEKTERLNRLLLLMESQREKTRAIRQVNASQVFQALRLLQTRTIEQHTNTVTAYGPRYYRGYDAYPSSSAALEPSFFEPSFPQESYLATQESYPAQVPLFVPSLHFSQETGPIGYYPPFENDSLSSLPPFPLAESLPEPRPLKPAEDAFFNQLLNKKND